MRIVGIFCIFELTIPQTLLASNKTQPKTTILFQSHNPRMENLFRHMNAVYPLSDSTLETLAALLEPVQFRKKEFIITEGGLSRSVFFISKGLTRSFWLKDGEEITTSFAGDGAAVFSMDEFYNGEISQEFVQAIEPTNAYRINLSDFNRLLSEKIDLCNYFLRLHQKEYRRIHQSHMERLTLSAADRYDIFCREFPDIVRRVNLSYIASYLGISQATLSRLRTGSN